MKHVIKIGGLPREIDIRPMDGDFIIYRKMYVPPLNEQNIAEFNPGDWREHLEEFKSRGWQDMIKKFLERQVSALGSCAILAWESAGVIGKMYFTTEEMYAAFRARDGWPCVESRSMPAVIQSLSDAEMTELLESKSRSLRILCFNVGHFDRRYHGQGIATAMLDCLKQWGRERGWQRILAGSCPDITPTTVVGAHMLRRGAFERRGFSVIEKTTVPPEQAQARLHAIKALAGRRDGHRVQDEWYVRNFNRLHAVPGWKSEFDRDYVMACDL